MTDQDILQTLATKLDDMENAVHSVFDYPSRVVIDSSAADTTDGTSLYESLKSLFRVAGRR